MDTPSAEHFFEKRYLMPNGPKVGLLALSPSGDLRMPSDTEATVSLEDVDRIPDEEE